MPLTATQKAAAMAKLISEDDLVDRADPAVWEGAMRCDICGHIEVHANHATRATAGTTTQCPLEGVHEHAFRGPHRFHEWEPGT